MATPDTYRSGDDEDGGTPDEKIVQEAMRRFDICAQVENDCRQRMIADIKFANADSDNLYQWDSTTRGARGYGTLDERPCLTINKTRQHNLNIINDAKQNKPSIKINPVGNEATYEAAQIFEGICKHIEYISNAQAAYDTGTRFQVEGGIGWWRVITDYPNWEPKTAEEMKNQEIYIRRIDDPLTVYLDPDIKEADGSDARYGFVFDDMTRKLFNERFPKFKDIATKSPLDVSGDWVREDQVRVAEYFRMIETEDTLLSYADPLTGKRMMQRQSKMDGELVKAISADSDSRTIMDRKIEWFKIAGDKIIERSEWPGSTIPLVRVIGEETKINGELDRKGHTRSMKDPQRIYNYWSSAAVEFVALQSKTPYIGPMEAFSNLETYWDTANTVNHAWLPYNAYDEKGQKLPPPERQQPPTMAQAYIEGLKISSDEIMASSGQYQADLGMQGNEKSGVAIQQRQRQGDNATYHYIDNLAIAIRRTGKILIEIIPKIYDTPRIIKIMAEDGTEHEITIDPDAKQAYQKKQQEDQDTVQAIFNPNVGRYDVEADVGPAYATRRQEAFAAMVTLMKEDPDLMKVAGDLLMKAADFPMSEELAERLKRTIPPSILGDGPTPQEQQSQQALKQLDDVLLKTAQKLKTLQDDRSIEHEQKRIDWYKATTERMKLIADNVTSPADRDQMIHDIMLAEHQSTLDMVQAEHTQAIAPESEPTQQAAE